ncbi:gliding motility-associated C-terminal domain-containing protein [uncultured Hymenobacter sp.]|uniref:T9SS type B sorting domain-containing protein n=1 Tax=uncultured Hymenobacter sp. TaxID=170016 RepID=UPI0035CBAAE5
MPAELPYPALSTTRNPSLPISEPGRPASVSSSYPVRRARLTAGWLFLLLALLLSGAASTALAQGTPPPECSQDEKFINTWYFGQRAGLNFNVATDSIPPAVLTNSQMVAPAGSGVMSDGTGNLLFYTNGDTIWDRNHTIMANGTGLGGNPLATDGPLAIKKPGIVMAGMPTRYLVFTQGAQGGPGVGYSEIEIPAGGGSGTVITKNTPLARGTAEKMTGVFHKNGCDIWIIVHGWGSATSGTDNRGDSFLAYRVTPTGVQPAPVISTVGSLHAPTVATQGYRGQMKVSPDGEQLAVARFNDTPAADSSSSSVELFAFDATTGVVSNPRIIDRGAGRYYGVEFSPGRSRLYATVLSLPQLLQFDLSAANVPASRQVIPLNQTTPVNLGSMQAAPDGKIYVARENQPALGFITYPDSLGASVAYADDSLQLGGRRSGLGLPNFNQSSLLRVGIGADITACREITFQASFAVEASNLVYAWTFGDGTTSSVENPVHTYATPGNYTVTLRITNDCFCRETQGVIQVPGLPEPGSIAGPPPLCAGTAPAALTSTVNASGDAGLPLAYQWEVSSDNVTFTAINGATGASYQPTALPIGTTYFRRRAQLLLPDQSGRPYCTPSFTASVAITVVPDLVAGSIAADQTPCVGGPVAPLTSTALATGGTGTFAYQWESSPDNVIWTPVAGANGPDYAPGPLTVTTYYRRRVTSGPCGPKYSAPVLLRVLSNLVAGDIATNQPICAGATPNPLTSVNEASGTSTFAYQWEASTDNGTTWTAIPGATSATYAPGALTATTLFRRQASSSSACAPVFSNVVTITVTPALSASSIGSNQPVCAGSAAAPLTSTTPDAGGTGTFTYQWESSTDNVIWTAIPGATGPTLAPGALTTTTLFRRQVSSGACSTLSNVVTLTVVPALVAGRIADNQSFCAGGTPNALTSEIPATGGTGTIVYQWETSTDNGITWTPVGGATGPTYVPGVLTTTTLFRRQASSGSACAPAVSNVVTITVIPALLAGSIGSNQPLLCLGAIPAPLTSTAGASGGTSSYSYQWEFSPNNAAWTPVAGATGPDYAPGPLTTTTYYRRRVTSGSCGPEYTASVLLTVLPALNAGRIANDQPICAGAAPNPLTSTSEANGATGTFAYQWESSADNVNWAAVPGATSSTFAPGPLTADTYYRRRVTSGTGTCSTDVSNVVTIRVQPVVTTGVSLAAPPVQCPGTALTFTAVPANAGAAPTFRWLVNNVAVASGATFTSSTLVSGDQVQVEVTPTAGLCSTGPAVATVTVTRTPTLLPSLGIAVQPGGPVCLGAPLTFNVAGVTEGGSTPEYQWQVNGTDVAGATGLAFTSTTLREGQIVTARLRTTNTCGQPATAVSNGVAVRIQLPVDVDAGPDMEILAGTSVTLNGRADGTYPVTWTPTTGLVFPTSDRLQPRVSPTVTTTYTLSGGEGGCADSDQVTVTVRPPIRIPNAFTPNGDGRDDTWQIEFIEQFPDNTVSVFNRWGNRIFSANNYSRANEWRGDINGQPAPVGTYYYVVVTKGPLGKSYSGSITILY